jgi:uncharacterized membrane protein YkgB
VAPGLVPIFFSSYPKQKERGSAMSNLSPIDTLSTRAQRFAAPFLRISLGLVLLWIGALKFADPSPVIDILEASFSFLAFEGFVYLLGVFEIAAAVLLFLGVGVRYVGLALIGMFAGTLVIFLIAPALSYGKAGFPMLSLAGEFLLKDVVLMAATVALLALQTDGNEATQPR